MVKNCFYLASLVLLVVGCSSGGSAVVAPKIDPVEAAAAAIAEYDANSDGSISSDEAKVSALDPKFGWDADGDGDISEQEIVDRLTMYEALKPGINMMTCSVLYRGRPIQGATVTFEPEGFLGDAIEVATGTTDIDGTAEMVAEEILAKDPTLRGIRAGLYKVRVTHPEVKISPKYNEETTLFFELSPMDMIQPPVFRVK